MKQVKMMKLAVGSYAGLCPETPLKDVFEKTPLRIPKNFG